MISKEDFDMIIGVNMINLETKQIESGTHFIDGPSDGKKIALPTYPYTYYVPILDEDKNHNLVQREAIYVRHTAILPCGLWEYYYKFERMS